MRVPVPTGSATDLTILLGEGRQRGRHQRRRQGCRDRTAGRRPGVHRGADRLHRHRHLAGVVHLRRTVDQVHGQLREGHGLVRQRVGLLLPAGRPHQLRGRASVTVAELSDLELDGTTVLLRADFNVPLEDADGGRRITDDGRIVAALPPSGRCRTAAPGWWWPPTSAGRRAFRRRSSRWLRWRRGSPNSSTSRWCWPRTSPVRAHRQWWTRWDPARSRCWRTCGSIRVRRRRTRRAGGIGRRVRRPCRRLRLRRLRCRAP